MNSRQQVVKSVFSNKNCSQKIQDIDHMIWNVLC